MEDKVVSIEYLFEKAEQFSKTNIELFKLKILSTTADVVATLISRFAIVIFIALFFLLLSVGISLYLGELLGKTYYGFFMMAGIYALFGIILYVFRNDWVETVVSDSIIKQALKK